MATKNLQNRVVNRMTSMPKIAVYACFSIIFLTGCATAPQTGHHSPAQASDPAAPMADKAVRALLARLPEDADTRQLARQARLLSVSLYLTQTGQIKPLPGADPEAARWQGKGRPSIPAEPADVVGPSRPVTLTIPD